VVGAKRRSSFNVPFKFNSIQFNASSHSPVVSSEPPVCVPDSTKNERGVSWGPEKHSSTKSYHLSLRRAAWEILDRTVSGQHPMLENESQQTTWYYRSSLDGRV
jgi:hypothetical protein